MRKRRAAVRIAFVALVAIAVGGWTTAYFIAEQKTEKVAVFEMCMTDLEARVADVERRVNPFLTFLQNALAPAREGQ